jgi:hypothetical protein
VEGVLQQFLMILKNINEIWNNKENKRKRKRKRPTSPLAIFPLVHCTPFPPQPAYFIKATQI